MRKKTEKRLIDEASKKYNKKLKPFNDEYNKKIKPINREFDKELDKIFEKFRDKCKFCGKFIYDRKIMPKKKYLPSF